MYMHKKFAKQFLQIHVSSETHHCIRLSIYTKGCSFGDYGGGVWNREEHGFNSK